LILWCSIERKQGRRHKEIVAAITLTKSMSRRFVVGVAFSVGNEIVDNGEQGFFLLKAEAVIDADLGCYVLRRLAVAAIQEAVCRSNTGGACTARSRPMFPMSDSAICR
jgi:hypothetical protein